MTLFINLHTIENIPCRAITMMASDASAMLISMIGALSIEKLLTPVSSSLLLCCLITSKLRQICMPCILHIEETLTLENLAIFASWSIFWSLRSWPAETRSCLESARGSHPWIISYLVCKLPLVSKTSMRHCPSLSWVPNKNLLDSVTISLRAAWIYFASFFKNAWHRILESLSAELLKACGLYRSLYRH